MKIVLQVECSGYRNWDNIEAVFFFSFFPLEASQIFEDKVSITQQNVKPKWGTNNLIYNKVDGIKEHYKQQTTWGRFIIFH